MIDKGHRMFQIVMDPKYIEPIKDDVLIVEDLEVTVGDLTAPSDNMYHHTPLRFIDILVELDDMLRNAELKPAFHP